MSEGPPIAAFAGKYRFLSNFWPASVIYDGRMYRTVEHAYQAAKTLNPRWREQVAAAISPARAKTIARRSPKRPNWPTVKLEVMEGLLRQKFSDPEMRAALAATRGRDLVEGNTWGDTFWGVCNGVGENHLGRLLMQIRDEQRR